MIPNRSFDSDDEQIPSIEILLAGLFILLFVRNVSLVLFRIVGGWCSGESTANAEMFDPIKNEWRSVAPMSKRRYGLGVGVLNHCLYAIGGHDSLSYLNSVER